MTVLEFSEKNLQERAEHHERMREALRFVRAVFEDSQAKMADEMDLSQALVSSFINGDDLGPRSELKMAAYLSEKLDRVRVYVKQRRVSQEDKWKFEKHSALIRENADIWSFNFVDRLVLTGGMTQ